MDVLHKVNLHIFVQFQDYIAHTYGEYSFGPSIYELTQAFVESAATGEHVGLARGEMYSLWMCFRTAWIYGASTPPQGHGESCYYCHKACDSLAGNPSMWPVGLSHPDDPGRMKWHHTGCVSERLDNNKE